MKLCVDVGNTTIGFGFFLEDKLKEEVIVNSDLSKLEDEYFASLHFLFKEKNINFLEVSSILFSSVVPSLNEPLKNVLKKLFINASFYMLLPESSSLKMDIDNPKEVGSDLIADLVGAKEKYKTPLIVIDLGTATKMLLLDKNQTFISALIMPGLKVSSDSLFQKAALLPEVDLSNPTSLLDSKNTELCIKHGVVFGHIESIIGLCNRYEKELGYRLNKIVTGGALPIISTHLPKDYILDDSLTLEGELFILNNIISKGE